MASMDNGVDVGRAGGKRTDEGVYKLYVALGYLPVALYALFVAIAFVAFAFPIASYDSANSGIAFDSPGSIYTALACLLDIDIHIHNCVITLYTAVGIATAYLIFAAVVCFNGKYGKRTKNCGIGASFAGNVSSVFYMVYIVFATLSLTIIGRIIAMDDGNGVLAVGAASVTVAATELAVIVLSAVSVYIRYRLELKHDWLRDTEQQARHAA